MDPIDREILALRHFEELNNSETAAVLGLHKAAASNRYVRALRRLKEILAPALGLGRRLGGLRARSVNSTERRGTNHERIDRRPQSRSSSWPRSSPTGFAAASIRRSPSTSSATPSMPTTSAICFPRWPWSNSSSRRGNEPDGVAGRVGAGGSRQTSPQQLGDYRILRYLGEGGMGVVYEAVRESLRSHVALKVMHPQYRNRANYLRRFHTEARSAARLHHTNIVSVFDYGEHDGVCYYAMQYIAGQSLDKVLDDVRQLRREKEGLSAGDTDHLGRVDASARPADQRRRRRRPMAERATDSLRQTVTLGLLTGRFATAAAERRLRASRRRHRPSEAIVDSPTAETATRSRATATRRLVSRAAPGRGHDAVPRMSGLPRRERP